MSHSDWDDILEPGEEILWQGRSEGGFHRKDIRTFDIVFTAFCVLIFAGIVAEVSLSAAGENQTQRLLIAGLLSSIGVFLIVGKPYLIGRARRRHFYTLTTKAAYIGDMHLGRPRLRRYNLTGPFILEGGDIGSVWFAKKRDWNSRSRKPKLPVGFVHIKNPEHVYGLIATARRTAP